MGKKWDYDVPSVEVWAECLRVLRPGGHLLAFAGTRTQHRMAVRIEDAGFEIRDMIAWVYGSGFPKSHNLKGEWQGWGTALKPALEPITVARKSLAGTVAENVLEHGTGGLNIDGTRVAMGDEYDPTRMQRQQHSSGAIDGAFGAASLIGTEIQTYKEGGRWPANLIHDGSDEVTGLFPDVKGSKGSGLTQTKARSWKNTSTAGINRVGHDDSGSAARFFYCAKASKRDRDEGLEGFQAKSKRGPMTDSNWSGNERFDGAALPTARNVHPTVKPTALMRYLCRLVTPPGGTVLDPFMGSGSTGKAAVLEGFGFIGIEREEEYLEIAKARIGAADPLFQLTASV